MIKFPSIEQFRNVIRNSEFKARNSFDEKGEKVFNRAAPLPKLNFHGTVKLHGTNAAIVFMGEEFIYQSRERVLTLDEDNAGFVDHMHYFLAGESTKKSTSGGPTPAEFAVSCVMDSFCRGVEPTKENPLCIYGEWCGGNVNKGVGINGLPKMFVIFAVKFNDEWQDLDSLNIEENKLGIYNIEDFATWDVCIDMEDPKLMQNTLSELTIKVEEECPVAKHFGNTGVGEGIVWKCSTEGWNSSDFWFKVKGEKHQASRVTTLAPVDMEKHAKLTDFVNSVVTDARCEQGLQNLVNEQLKPFEMQSMGDFIRWVVGDIMKEEGDTIEANGFNRKQLGSPISEKARKWYVEALNTCS